LQPVTQITAPNTISYDIVQCQFFQGKVKIEHRPKRAIKAMKAAIF
jgi:hypothetical protein